MAHLNIRPNWQDEPCMLWNCIAPASHYSVFAAFSIVFYSENSIRMENSIQKRYEYTLVWMGPNCAYIINMKCSFMVRLFSYSTDVHVVVNESRNHYLLQTV